MKKICASEIKCAFLRVLFEYCNSAGAQNMQGMHLGRAGQSGTSFPNTNQPARAMTPPSKTTADHLLVSCNTPCTEKNYQLQRTRKLSITEGNSEYLGNSWEIGHFQPCCPRQGFGLAWVRNKDDCWITVSLWDARHNRQQLSAL